MIENVIIAHLPLRYGEVPDPYPNKQGTRRLTSHVSQGYNHHPKKVVTVKVTATAH